MGKDLSLKITYEKRMFSRVEKCSVGSSLSCVFMMEIIYKMSRLYGRQGGSVRFRKINEVFDLGIRANSLLAYVVFSCKLPSWKDGRFS